MPGWATGRSVAAATCRCPARRWGAVLVFDGDVTTSGAERLERLPSGATRLAGRVQQRLSGPNGMAILRCGPIYVFIHDAPEGDGFEGEGHTLGKLGPRENARHLRAALPWYAHHDPLRLDQLLFELGWLLGRRRLWRRELLTQLVRSPSCLTRWVTVAILWERELVRGRSEFGSGRSPGWALQLMRILAQDQHSFVREDARRALAERRRHRLQRPVVRNPKGLLADESLESNPRTFELQIATLAILVNNYLYGSGEADYDIALVEDVARHSHQNPIRPGYDPKHLLVESEQRS